ncbi:MAG: hypothetical protein ACE5IW_09400 [bacterium]
MVDMTQLSKRKNISDLFEKRRVTSEENHRRSDNFIRLFYAFCLVILLTIAFDLSKIWGFWGFLPSAVILVGLLYRFTPIAILGVPLSIAHPWIMWLNGRTPSSIFWVMLALYSVYFLYTRIQSKRKK